MNYSYSEATNDSKCREELARVFPYFRSYCLKKLCNDINCDKILGEFQYGDRHMFSHLTSRYSYTFCLSAWADVRCGFRNVCLMAVLDRSTRQVGVLLLRLGSPGRHVQWPDICLKTRTNLIIKDFVSQYHTKLDINYNYD